jgi:hypothetical protein
MDAQPGTIPVAPFHGQGYDHYAGSIYTGSIYAVLPVIAVNIEFLRLICPALKGFAIGGRSGSGKAPEKAYKMIGALITDFQGYFGNG